MNLLEFRGVGFDDGRHAPIRSLDFSLERGQRLFVFGRSGSGKGTLLRLAAGVVHPGSGAVRLAVGPDCRVPVGYVPREGGLLNNISLLENALLPLVYHKTVSASEAQRKALALFEELGIAGQADRRAAEVGVSVRRLALMARAVLAAPPLYVLEDPLSEVDAAAARTIKALIQRLGKEGASCIVAAVHLSVFEGWEGSYLFLRGGKAVIFEDEEALSRTTDADVRACID